MTSMVPRVPVAEPAQRSTKAPPLTEEIASRSEQSAGTPSAVVDGVMVAAVATPGNARIDPSATSRTKRVHEEIPFSPPLITRARLRARAGGVNLSYRDLAV